jgi:hypothetical protein
MAQRRSGRPSSGGEPAERGEFQAGEGVRTALIAGATFRAKPVKYVVVDGDALFEGDIVLGTAEQVERDSETLKAEIRGELAAGVLISGSQFRWPNCTVPYDIDAALPSQNRVTDAIAHWEANTRFRFVLRTAANAAQYQDWVTFRPSSGCSSSVGRRGGQQFVNLGSGCTTGNTIHEIGHVVGLWHEQSREDRDAFVTINWANIQSGMQHNFDQHIADGDDVGAYDYGSIMHYPRNAFGINGAETITPVDPNAQIGQRTGLSPGDIAAANSMCPKLVKERFPETIKELSTEAVKELQPETLKEIRPETVKERFPETIKEIRPETIKELGPETRKELIETVVENVIPGPGPVINPPFVNPPVINPPVVNPIGAVPFAVATPHAGLTGDPVSDLGLQVAALGEVVAELQAGQEALAAQLGALLGQLGLQ